MWDALFSVVDITSRKNKLDLLSGVRGMVRAPVLTLKQGRRSLVLCSLSVPSFPGIRSLRVFEERGRTRSTQGQLSTRSPVPLGENARCCTAHVAARAQGDHRREGARLLLVPPTSVRDGRRSRSDAVSAEGKRDRCDDGCRPFSRSFPLCVPRTTYFPPRRRCCRALVPLFRHSTRMSSFPPSMARVISTSR